MGLDYEVRFFEMFKMIDKLNDIWSFYFFKVDKVYFYWYGKIVYLFKKIYLGYVFLFLEFFILFMLENIND